MMMMRKDNDDDDDDDDGGDDNEVQCDGNEEKGNMVTMVLKQKRRMSMELNIIKHSMLHSVLLQVAHNDDIEDDFENGGEDAV